jgi:hypothetical protein
LFVTQKIGMWYKIQFFLTSTALTWNISRWSKYLMNFKKNNLFYIWSTALICNACGIVFIVLQEKNYFWMCAMWNVYSSEIYILVYKRMCLEDMYMHFALLGFSDILDKFMKKQLYKCCSVWFSKAKRKKKKKRLCSWTE